MAGPRLSAPCGNPKFKKDIAGRIDERLLSRYRTSPASSSYSKVFIAEHAPSRRRRGKDGIPLPVTLGTRFDGGPSGDPDEGHRRFKSAESGYRCEDFDASAAGPLTPSKKRRPPISLSGQPLQRSARFHRCWPLSSGSASAAHPAIRRDFGLPLLVTKYISIPSAPRGPIRRHLAAHDQRRGSQKPGATDTVARLPATDSRSRSLSESRARAIGRNCRATAPTYDSPPDPAR